ncbi:hypothetical protein DFH09DRAFT_1288260 [Mycena vulgaris]|nr:hypothetical protein DFH09DRAFT_1288260 [Mycena vulgaris]
MIPPSPTMDLLVTHPELTPAILKLLSDSLVSSREKVKDLERELAEQKKTSEVHAVNETYYEEEFDRLAEALKAAKAQTVDPRVAQLELKIAALRSENNELSEDTDAVQITLTALQMKYEAQEVNEEEGKRGIELGGRCGAVGEARNNARHELGELNKEIAPSFVSMADVDEHTASLDLSSLATSLPEDDSALADPPASSELPAQLRRKMASQMSSQAQDASDSRQELELARLKGGIRQHAINALRRQAVVEAEYLEQENSNGAPKSS